MARRYPELSVHARSEASSSVATQKKDRVDDLGSRAHRTRLAALARSAGHLDRWEEDQLGQGGVVGIRFAIRQQVFRQTWAKKEVETSGVSSEEEEVDAEADEVELVALAHTETETVAMATCVVCFDHLPPEHGVSCREGHFLCGASAAAAAATPRSPSSSTTTPAAALGRL